MGAAPNGEAGHQTSGAGRGGAAAALSCAAIGIGACIILDDDAAPGNNGEAAAEDAAISVQSSSDAGSSLRTPSAASANVSPLWGSPNALHASSLDRKDRGPAARTAIGALLSADARGLPARLHVH